LRLFFAFPDHGDDAGSATEKGPKHGGRANDGVIGAPHDIAAHQVTAGDSFIPGGDEEHTEYGADDRQQFQQILTVDGKNETRRGK